MKSFRDFLNESEAPASVDANVGKPVGQVKKKGKEEPDLIQTAYKGLSDRLGAIDKAAKERREEGEETLFQKLFRQASDDMKSTLGKK